MFRLRPYECLMCLRLALATLIAVALPMSHVQWGQDPQTAGIDGQQATGFVLVFLGIGLIAALVYFVGASAVHYVFRARPKRVAWIDLAIAVPVITALVFAGITARYASGSGVP